MWLRELGKVETNHNHHHHYHHLYDNFMKPTPSWETSRSLASQEIPPNFVEPEGSLQPLQQPATCTFSGTVHKWFCSCLWNFTGAFTKLRKATVSFVISVCPAARNNSAATGRIFSKFDIGVFFEHLSRKFKFN